MSNELVKLGEAPTVTCEVEDCDDGECDEHNPITCEDGICADCKEHAQFRENTGSECCGARNYLHD